MIPHKGLNKQPNQLSNRNKLNHISMSTSHIKETNYLCNIIINLARTTFNKLGYILISAIYCTAKKKLWMTFVLPVLINGAEAWMLMVKTKKKFCVEVRNMSRVRLVEKRSDKITTSWAEKQTGKRIKETL